MARPTIADTKLITRIAHNPPLIKTHGDGDHEYSLGNGEPVNKAQAERLIINGWVIGNKDGLLGMSQSYRTRRPTE
jgi:hypothetical protein